MVALTEGWPIDSSLSLLAHFSFVRARSSYQTRTLYSSRRSINRRDFKGAHARFEETRLRCPADSDFGISGIIICVTTEMTVAQSWDR